MLNRVEKLEVLQRIESLLNEAERLTGNEGINLVSVEVPFSRLVSVQIFRHIALARTLSKLEADMLKDDGEQFPAFKECQFSESPLPPLLKQ